MATLPAAVFIRHQAYHQGYVPISPTGIASRCSTVMMVNGNSNFFWIINLYLIFQDNVFPGHQRRHCPEDLRVEQKNYGSRQVQISGLMQKRGRQAPILIH